MSTSKTITRTDLANILNEVLPCPSPVSFLGKIASVQYKGTSTGWEYTGMSFTVPPGHRYLVSLYTGWSSGKPIGLGIGYSPTLGAEGYPYYNFENANGITSTPIWALSPNTYYVFAKRATTPSSTNNHEVYAWDFHSGVMPVTDLQADYIVEQGTSGNWTYRKWNSGVAEAWMGPVSAGSITMTSAWGYGYYSSLKTYYLPSSLFTSAPALQVHGNLTGGLGGFTLSNQSNGTSFDGYWWSTKSETRTTYLNAYAKGKWK